MANKKTGLPAGYGNGGIDTMDQCAKLSNKITNALENLEITRDMLRKIAANEEKSAKGLQEILNTLKQITRSKGSRFSVIDRPIQNYWRKKNKIVDYLRMRSKQRFSLNWIKDFFFRAYLECCSKDFAI
eukprot:778644_1